MARKTNQVKYTSQYLDNLGLDESTLLPMVEVVGTDGTVDAEGNPNLYRRKVANDGSSPANITQVGGANVTLGQNTRANSIPVTLPSDGAGVAYGTWGYNAGTSGTLTLTGGKRVLQITAIAEEVAATITINGGDTITLPYGSTDKVSSAIEIKPLGNVTNPTIVFTNTKAFFVEYVS